MDIRQVCQLELRQLLQYICKHNSEWILKQQNKMENKNGECVKETPTRQKSEDRHIHG